MVGAHERRVLGAAGKPARCTAELALSAERSEGLSVCLCDAHRGQDLAPERDRHRGGRVRLGDRADRELQIIEGVGGPGAVRELTACHDNRHPESR